MSTRKPRLFDSYSGSHVAQVLDSLEQRVEAEMRKESGSEFLQGELSAVREIREVLSEARYAAPQLRKAKL